MQHKQNNKICFLFTTFSLCMVLTACVMTPSSTDMGGIEVADSMHQSSDEELLKTPTPYYSKDNNQSISNQEIDSQSEMMPLRFQLFQEDITRITREYEKGNSKLLISADIVIPDVDEVYTGRLIHNEPDIELIKQALWDGEDGVYQDISESGVKKWRLSDREDIVNNFEYIEEFYFTGTNFNYTNYFLDQQYINYNGEIPNPIDEKIVYFTEQQAEKEIYDFLEKIIGDRVKSYKVVNARESLANDGMKRMYYLTISYTHDNIPFISAFNQQVYKPEIYATVTEDGVIKCSGDLFIEAVEKETVKEVTTFEQMIENAVGNLDVFYSANESMPVNKLECVYVATIKTTSLNADSTAQITFHPALLFHFDIENAKDATYIGDPCFRLDNGEFSLYLLLHIQGE